MSTRFLAKSTLSFFLILAAALTAYGQEHFQYQRTDNNMSVLVTAATLNGESLVENDEIGVFTEDDLCAGAAAVGADFPNQPAGMAAWGTEQGQNNGFAPNEDLAFRVWDHAADEEFVAEANAVNGQLIYTINGFTVVTLAAEGGQQEEEPNIVIAEDAHDFGDVAVGAAGEWILNVSNDGEADLLIQNIETQGEYFAVDFQEEATVEPGGEVEFTVSYAPEEAGDHQGTLTVTSDDPDNGEIEVSLTGSAFEEGAHFEFVRTDANMSVLVTEALIGGESLVANDEIGVFTTDDFCAGAVIIEDNFPDSPAGLAAWGTEQGQRNGFNPGEDLAFRVWDHQARQEYQAGAEVVNGRLVYTANGFVVVTLSAEGGEPQPELFVNEDEHDFGGVVVGEEANWTLTIGNSGDADLVVTEITSDNEAFNAVIDEETTIEPEGEAEFTVTFSPDAADVFQAALTIYSNDPDGEHVVQLSGTGVEAEEPDIVLPQEVHDFGDVVVGRSEEWTFEIGNDGDLELVIENMAVDGQYFFVNFENEVTIASGNSTEFTVTFAPEEVGEFEGTLTIASNDPDEGELTVDLTGAGIQQQDEAAIIVEPDILQFGRVMNGEAEGMAVAISNAGGEDLVIDAVDLESEVFSHDFEEEITVASGESTEIMVTFTPDESISFISEMTIHSNDPENGEIAVRMIGMGYSDQDERHFNFRRTDNNMSILITEATLDGESITEGDEIGVFTGQGFCAGSEPIPDGFPENLVGIAAWGAEPENINGFMRDEEMHFVYWIADEQLEIEAVANFPNGENAYQPNGVLIGTLSGETPPMPEIVIEENAHDFGEAAVGESVDWELTVRNNGDADLIISAMDIEGDYFTADFDGEVAIEPESDHVFTITFAPEEEGRYNATLTVSSNDRHNPDIDIALRGVTEGFQPPTIAFDPGEIDFDLVFLGEAGESILTVSNTGDEALVISAAAIESEVFAIGFENEITLQPDESVELTVTFEPNASGMHEAGAVFESNDPNNEQASVHLMGRGFALGEDHYYEFENTDNNMSLLIIEATFDGESIVQFDEIGAFTPGGLCAGGVSIPDGFPEDNAGMAVWGAEQDQDNGFHPGEEISFRVWLHEANMEYDANAQLVNGSLEYTINGFTVVNISAESEPIPDISLDEWEHNFGAVEIGEAAEWTFTVTNIGEADLVIDDMEIDERAFSVDFDQEVTLEMEQQAEFTVTFRPEEEGRFAGVLSIHSNDPRDEIVQIDLTGVTVGFMPPTIAVEPQELDFGRVVVEENRALTISISNEGDEVLSIQDIASNNEIFAVDFEGAFDIEPHESSETTIVFSPVEGGDYEGDLTIRSNDPENGEVMVAMTGVGFDPDDMFYWEYETTDVNMSVLITEATLDGESLVENDAIGVFTPDGLCAGGEYVPAGFPDERMGIAAWAAEQNLDNGFHQGEDLAFRFWDHNADEEWDAEAEGVNGEVIFTPNGFLVVTLSAVREVVEAPEIEVSELMHNFGVVAVGESDDWNFTVSNHGNADLIIAEMPVEGDYFSVNFENEIAIEPDNSAEFTVTFAPEAEGSFEAVLTIRSNDPDNEEVEIELMGTTEEDAAPPMIAVEPEEINFGQVVINARRNSALTITNEGEAVLIVDEIAVDNDAFAVEFDAQLELEAGQSAELTVAFAPDAIEQFEGDLTIHSNDPENGEIVVHLMGAGIEPGGPHFRFVNTDANMSILVLEAVLDGESLVENDEIGVFTPDGLCAGGETVHANFPDEALGLAAWGAEQNMDNGFHPDEALAFRVWDHAAQEEWAAEAEAVGGGELVWQVNGFQPVNLTAIREVEEAPAIETEFNGNFGAVAVGESLDRTLTIANAGDADLVVSDISVEGDYFTVNFEEEATIEPDARQEFTVTFAPEEAGVYEGELSVTSNDPENEVLLFDLNGIGGEQELPNIAVEPDNIDFGEVNVGEAVQEQITIQNTGNADLEIEDIMIDGDGFGLGEIAIGEEVIEFDWDFIMSDQNMSILIQSAALNGEDLAAGNYVGVFNEAGNCCGFSEVEDQGAQLGVTGWAAEDQDEPFGFSNGDPIEYRYWIAEESREYIVSNIDVINGVQNEFVINGLIVLNLGADDDDRLAVGVLEPDEEMTAAVNFEPPQVGEFAGSVMIVSNDPDSPEVEVGLAGDGFQAAPAIVLSSGEHDFGRVRVGDSVEWTFTISNGGNEALEVESVETIGDYFADNIDEAFSLDPQAELNVTVVFSPEEIGEFEGGVVIASNDPNNGEARVELSGIGRDPEERHYDFERTDANMSFLIQAATLDNESLVEGDEIGAFTPDGLCAGAEVVPDGFPDEQLGLAAWGAEQNQDNGFHPGEEVAFRIWDHFADEEFEAEAEIVAGGLAWQINGFAVVRLEAFRGGEDQPEIAVDFDGGFGIVAAGESLDRTLTISNAGAADLTVENIAVEGAGFAVDFEQETTIEPDAMHEFTVTFEPDAIEDYQGTLTITSNDPNHAEIQIDLTGAGGGAIIAVEPDEIDFGAVAVNEEAVRNLTISNIGNMALTVTDISIDDEEHFRVDFGDIEEEFDWEFVRTEINMSIIVQNVDHGGEDLAAGNVVGVFTEDGVCAGFAPVEEPGAQIGLAVWGDDQTTEDIVEGFMAGEEIFYMIWDNEAHQEFNAVAEYTRGEGVWTANGFAVCDLTTQREFEPGDIMQVEIEPEGSVEVPVYFMADEAGDYDATLTVSSDDPNNGELDVPVQAQAEAGDADIEVSADAHDFGGVNVGESAEWTFTISNLGQDVLTIENIEVDNDAFTIDPADGFELEGEASREVMVTFTPDDRGGYEGDLAIMSDDEDEGEIHIALTGSGNRPDIEVDADQIDFGEADINEEVERSFTLRNEGNVDLVVEEIAVDDEDHFRIEFDQERQEFDWEFTITENNMSIIVNEAVLNGEDLGAGGYAGVFTPEGLCAGYSEVEEPGEQIGIAAWGDDPNTQEIDGFRADEEIGYRFWDSEAGREYETEAAYQQGDGVYAANGFAVVDLEAGGNVDPDDIAESVIEPDGELEVFVYFQSDEEGDYEAVVTITSNDPYDGELEIGLRALVGVEPPQIALSDNAHDFGDVLVGNGEEWTFTITNEGGAVLEIDSVTTAGDYFADNIDEAFNLEPGADREVTVTFAPEEAGDFEGMVLITSNDPDNGEIEVALAGRGVDEDLPDIELSTDEIDFGEVPAGEVAEEILTIANRGGAVLEIEEISIDGDEVFDVQFEGGQGGDFDWDFVITDANMSVLIQNATLNGEDLVEGDVIGVFTEDGDCAGYETVEEPGAQIGVTAWGSEQGEDNGFQPNEAVEFRFWDNDAGFEFVVDEVQIINGVQQVYVTNGLLVANLAAEGEVQNQNSIEPGDEMEVTVTFAPEEAGEFNAIITVLSNDPDEGEADVALTGTSSEPMPEIEVSADEHDFGRVILGEEREWTFTIANIGEEVLEVESVETAGDYFSDNVDEGFALEPEESREVTVTFSPEEAGEFEGTVVITSNDPDRQEVNIALSGVGRDPDERYFRFDRTDTNMSVLVQDATLDGESLAAGDEIGIFTPDGLCAGGEVVPQGFPDERIGLAAWGAENERDNGFHPDEELFFHVWDHNADEEWEAEAEFEVGENVWQVNGFAVVILTAERIQEAPAIDYPEAHDFGGVMVGASREWTLEIGNTGDADLIIQGLEINNGQFEVSFDEEISIAPDESSEFTVTYAPDEVGDHQGILTVTSNDPQNGEVEIALSGTGFEPEFADIELDQDEIDFGDVPVNEFRVMDLTGRNAGDAELVIADLQTQGDGFSVAFEDEIVVQPGEDFAISVRFEPDEEREYQGILTISSNDPNDDQLEVALTGSGIEEGAHFRYRRTDLNMSVIVREATIRGESLIEGDEVGAFTADGLCAGAGVVDGEGFPLGLAAWADDPHTQEIDGFRNNEAVAWRIWDDDAGREYNGIANYVQGDGRFHAESLTVVNLSAEIVEEGPQIAVNALQHDYGRLLLGDEEMWELVIMNTGEEALILESMETDNEAFSIDGFEENVEIEPEASISVDVTFTPDEVMEYEATLTIASNDPNTPELNITLLGEGIEEAPPQIGLSAMEFDFGEVEIDTEADWMLRISNAGGSILQVEELEIDGFGFTVEPAEAFELEIDGEREVTITFAPDDEIDFNASLIIRSNDPGDQVVEVSLSGVGVPPDYHWEFIETDNNMSLLIQEISVNEEQMAIDGQVGVFTEDGICAGVSVIREYPVGLAAWGDDPNTEDVVEGFTEDQELFYRLWDPDLGREMDAEAEYIEGEGFYEANGVAVLNLTAMFEQHFENPVRTDNNHTLLVQEAVYDGDPLAAGDEVAVLTEDGTVAGLALLNDPGDEQFGLTAWGDDAATEDVIEGFVPGEEFTFMVWDSDAEVELEADPEWIDDGPRVYTINGFTALRLEAHEIVNDPPEVVQGIDNITVDEDPGQVVVADLDDVFEDPDGDELAFAFAGAPDEINMSLDNENVLSFTPDENYNLPDGVEITVTATDPGEESAEDVFMLTISPINDAPEVIDPIDDITVDEDPGQVAVADLNEVFFDPDFVNGDELRFSLNVNELPEELGLGVDEDGVLSFRPADNFNIPNGLEVVITAADAEDASADESFVVTITPVNDDPELVEAIGDVEIDEDTNVFVIAEDLTDHFIDVDNDLEFDFEGAPEEVNMAVEDGVTLVIRPEENFNIPDGVEITIIASEVDGRAVAAARFNPFQQNRQAQLNTPDRGVRRAGHIAGWNPRRDDPIEDTFTLTINPLPDDPEFEGDYDDTVFEEDLVEFTLDADDPDGDDLTFEMTDNAGVEDAQFNEETGEFSWQTELYDGGFTLDGAEYQFEFTVTDEDGNQDEIQVVITVEPIRPVILEPAEEPEFEVDVQEDEEIFIPLSAEDLTDDPEDLAWMAPENLGDLPGDPVFEDLEDGTAEFFWTPPFNAERVYRLLFIVNDPDEHADSITVTINVEDVNLAPYFVEPSDERRHVIDIDEGVEIEFDIMAVDPDDDELNYVLDEDLGDLPGNPQIVDGNDFHFSWTPPFEGADRNYEIDFYVNDGDLEDILTVVFNVNDRNPPPDIIGVINNVLMMEDAEPASIANLDTVFTDPEGGDLNFQFEGVPQGVELAPDNENELIITLDANFNMPDSVEVTVVAVEPGGLEGRESFWLMVEPVNDAPLPFSLLAPNDGYEIDRETYEVTFEWEESENVDAINGDEIKYAWYIHAVHQEAGVDTTAFVGDLEETSFTPEDLENYLISLGIYVTEGDVSVPVEWWIVAEDETDSTVQSTETWTIVVPVPVSVSDSHPGIPGEYSLSQNYPNPFNPTTVIEFALPNAADVRLSVWDLSGRRITDLVHGWKSAGLHQVEWNADGLPAGVYLIRFDSGEHHFMRKAILMR